MSDTLEARELRVARGGKTVLHGIDVRIPPGKITALLGPNGAGKSTLVLALAGALPLSGGRVVLGERTLSGLRPEAVRRLGVAAVPEGHRVLGDLTVEDNLRVAGNHFTVREMLHSVDEALRTFPELKSKLQSRAGDLSGGQQQMVVLAQAIVGRPKFLLADELSFGLAPVVVARLVPVIVELARQGIGILLIEQFTTVALQIADSAYVMERGRIRFSGSSDELRNDESILHGAYLSGA